MLAVILDRLPDTMISVGANGQIEWVSPNVGRLLGYRADELVGQDAGIIYAQPSDRRTVLELVSSGKGDAVRLEFEAKRKDGQGAWVVAYGCAVFDAKGAFAGVRGVLRDISENRRMRKTLEDSEDRFRRLSDVTSEGICIHFQGKILDCNRAFESLFGYSRVEFESMLAWNVIHTDDVPLAKEMVRQQHQKPYEVRGVRKDGSVFPMEIHSKESWMGGLAVRVTCLRDMTEQKKAEASLRLLSQAVEQSPVAVAVVTADGTIEYVNPAHHQMTGQVADQIIGRPFAEMYPGQAKSWFGDMWQSLRRGGDWEGEIPVTQGDGRLHWQRIFASPVATQSDDITHHLVVIEDVTLRKEQERKILHQAMYDGLTDLPNRSLALDRLTVVIEDARDNGCCIALLFVDLDDFKGINDSLGHEYGDELLILASERLRDSVGEGGMVARFGGDEFLVILSDCSPGQAENAAQAIVAAFSQPFTISRRDLITTASIGVALYPEDGRTPQTLLRNADIAMYQAKLAGRNRFCFFTARMNEEAEARLRLESELRRAVGTEQLFLHFQPLVHVDSGHVAGVEALLRWNNPELGSVPPDRFIPQAETCGLIVPIGRDVLWQACQTAKPWLECGHPELLLCVNVSPRQFQDGGFLDDVAQILRETGFPAANLELEITEGLLLRERGDIDGLLHGLHAMGVKLAIDDFGTGYSSLSYLERYPFHTLKIDRSFMVGMLERHERKVLVDTIVAMATGLGLKVIAEGVETVEQLARLKAIGCDIAQGYLFSRPVPAEQVLALLETPFGTEPAITKPPAVLH
ncbi:EAL domain-containing protein [Magnetospirillum sp. J10]|uniref:EAL domain-containing protein n=2 Tax=Magnetospirillum sulfuroxidans TaxID=611300 RepID=A0ABS5I7N1_9PROT|nr:EAL domain-containing protein [Magnetospirillum sulfuroxidans]